jgi:cytochrome P450
MLRDPVAHFQRLYDRYGAVSAWDPARPRHVFAFSPEYLRLLFSEPDLFIADAFREVNMPPESSFARLSTGLLRINGAEHRKHRRLIQPAFTARRIQVHHRAIVELTEEALAGWRDESTRRLDLDFSRLIMRIAIRTIFDITAEQDIEHLHGLVTRLLKVAAAPTTLVFPHDLPGTSYRAALRISESIEAALRSMIRDRRDTSSTRQDVLSTMIAARDEEGAALTDDEIVGEAYTSFCHESSAAGLTWTMFLLDQHPGVLREVVDELDSTLHGEPPAADQLPKLELLDRVLSESLRLLPPAAFAQRYTARPGLLGPYALPQDAAVFYSPYVTHRIPELYARPTVFDPARWESIERSAFEYAPWGAGAHHCVGKHFATFEIKIILAMLLQRFRPSVLPGTRIDRAQRISLVPSRGLPVVLHKPGTDRPAPAVRGNIHDSVALSR